jgi:hypothetical protein
MANYSTNLKTWGGTGEAFPDGYSYVEGEQPVDAWDNFVNYNLISDVSDHLIPLTNSRIETDKGASGNEPNSPETSHLYSDEGNEVLRRWNDTASVWRNIATEYWVNNSADVPNADYADNAGLYKGNDIDSDGDGVVDSADDATTVKGNDIDTDGDGIVDQADYATNAGDADTVDGAEAAGLLPLSAGAVGTVNEYSATAQSESNGGSWNTLVSFASPAKIYTGHLSAEYLSGIRITFDDGTQLTMGDTNDEGSFAQHTFGHTDTGSDEQGHFSFPYMTGVTEIEWSPGETNTSSGYNYTVLANQ